MGCRPLLTFWVACSTIVSAQIPDAAITPAQQFHITGSGSGWAWGSDRVDKFHLWRIDGKAMAKASLPTQLTDSGQQAYPGAFFLSADQGFLVWTQDRAWGSENGGATVAVATAKTEDSAASWHVESQKIQVTHPYGGVHELQFPDEQNGYVILGIGAAAGQTPKMLAGTHDGGRTWQELGKIPYDWTLGDSIVGGENAPVHMLFRTKDEGWILRGLSHGQRAPTIFLFHTTDGGAKWDQFDKFREPSECRPECWLVALSPLYFNPSNSREAFFWAGYSGLGKALQVYRTYNRGASWSGPQRTSVPGNVTFADFSFGIAQDGARIFVTSDSGHSWSANPGLSQMISSYKYAIITGMQRKGSSIWVLVTGLDRSMDSSAVLYSNDDGKNWSALLVR